MLSLYAVKVWPMFILTHKAAPQWREWIEAAKHYLDNKKSGPKAALFPQWALAC
jgi:hypothetical protein